VASTTSRPPRSSARPSPSPAARHNPLVEPEDLFEARIVEATPQALALGVQVGMTGREAVERLLAASKAG